MLLPVADGLPVWSVPILLLRVVWGTFHHKRYFDFLLYSGHILRNRLWIRSLCASSAPGWLLV